MPYLHIRYYKVHDCRCKLYAGIWVRCGENFDTWGSFSASQIILSSYLFEKIKRLVDGIFVSLFGGISIGIAIWMRISDLAVGKYGPI